jgi:hypothetical protein
MSFYNVINRSGCLRRFASPNKGFAKHQTEGLRVAERPRRTKPRAAYRLLELLHKQLPNVNSPVMRCAPVHHFFYHYYFQFQVYFINNFLYHFTQYIQNYFAPMKNRQPPWRAAGGESPVRGLLFKKRQTLLSVLTGRLYTGAVCLL